MGTLYDVKFLAHHLHHWGDIYAWHVVVGKGWFSAARRPVVLCPGALE